MLYLDNSHFISFFLQQIQTKHLLFPTLIFLRVFNQHSSSSCFGARIEFHCMPQPTVFPGRIPICLTQVGWANTAGCGQEVADVKNPPELSFLCAMEPATLQTVTALPTWVPE